MPNSNPAHFLAIRNAIFATLEAELSARLSRVAAVGEAWLNEIADYPYVHVSWQGLSQDDYAVRTRRATHNFVLGVAYKSTVSMQDAYTNAYALLDDGAGNGLLNVLNDPANYTWGGLAEKSIVKEITPYDNLTGDRGASPSSFVAYAVLRYQVIEYISFVGTVA